MSVTYRDAVSSDAGAIADLFRETFVATFGHLYEDGDLAAFLAEATADKFTTEIATPGFSFRLAEEHGTLAGFVKLGPDQLPDAVPKSLELWALYVRGGWHGRGVAATLMEWAIGQARRRGALAMRLTVFIDNHRARRFYERYGFVETGKYEFKVGGHVDDDRIMTLTL